MKKVQWRKTGGGTFRMRDGRIIKPNQVFKASPDEIPKAFRDTIIPLESLPEETEPVINPSIKFGIKERGAGWFDVVNLVSNKVMNKGALRRVAAEKLLEELS
jgi:hypothetical protein